MAIHGYGPNGRALKKDGTERKARTKLTVAEKMAKAQEMVRNAYASAGRDILVKCDSALNEGLAKIKGWAREATSFSTEEKRAAKRAFYEAKIAEIDAKGEIAEGWLPGISDALETISNLYSAIGEGFENLGPGATDEDIREMITDLVSEDVREIIESGNNPDADPYADYRRGAREEDTSGEDNDTL